MQNPNAMKEFLIVIGLVAGFLILSRVFRRVPKIQPPTLGMLDLTNGEAADDIAQDRDTIAPLFDGCVESAEEIPVCSVLYLYCDIELDGRIRGAELGLRDIIHYAQASVVVVARENESEAYIAAAAPATYGQANLVAL